MYTILSLEHYGFFPTIVGMLFIIFFLLVFRNNWKYNIIVICGYIFVCAIGSRISGGIYDTSILSIPSLPELIYNTSTWLTIYLFLCRTRFGHFIWFHFSFLSFLVGSIIFLIFGLEPLLFDALGIFITIIIFKYLKEKNKTQASIFLFSGVALILIVGISITQIDWKFLKKDFRASYLVHLYWKHLTPEDYYVCNNIDDTEMRFQQILDVLKKPSGTDTTIIFLEDSIAAFSFIRSTIRESWDGDGISYSSFEVGSIQINKHDSLLVGDIQYPPADVFFSIQDNGNSEIIVEGNFEKMSFSIFSSLQQYLKQIFPDLSNHKISLYNRNNEFKLGIQYFENDEYMLYLDNSFLKDSNMNNY